MVVLQHMQFNKVLFMSESLAFLYWCVVVLSTIIVTSNQQLVCTLNYVLRKTSLLLFLLFLFQFLV